MSFPTSQNPLGYVSSAAKKKVFHKTEGETELYEIDAHHAVLNFPDEWSFTPWPAQPAPAAGNAAPAAEELAP